MTSLIKTAKLTAIAILLAGTAFAQEAAPTPVASAADLSQVVATVNGDNILVGDIIALMEELPDEYRTAEPAEVFPQLVDQLVSQELLASEAAADDAKLNFRLSQAERATKVNTVLTETIDAGLTDEYLAQVYADVITDAPAEPEFKASHILVADEAAANELKAKIDAGEDFAELATANSSDGSAANGGDLGWFGKGAMVPEFEAAVIGLEVGGVSAPVQSQFGWHIVKLFETRDAEKPTFESVEPQLRQYAAQLIMEEKVNAVKEGAEIVLAEGVDPTVISAGF